MRLSAPEHTLQQLFSIRAQFVSCVKEAVIAKLLSARLTPTHIAFHDQQRSPDAFLFATIESPDDGSRCVLYGDPEHSSQHRSRRFARDKTDPGPDEGSGQVRTGTLQITT